MSLTQRIVGTALLCTSPALSALAADQVVDVRDCDAASDGKTLCTRAIQMAVDRCAGAGGGTVYLLELHDRFG
jgi:polygalacturonase